MARLKRLRKVSDKSMKQQRCSGHTKKRPVRLRNPLMHSGYSSANFTEASAKLAKGCPLVIYGYSSAKGTEASANLAEESPLVIYGYPGNGANARGISVYNKRAPLGQFGRCLGKFGRGVSVYNKREPLGQIGRCLGTICRGISVYNKRAPLGQFGRCLGKFGRGVSVYNRRAPSANLADASANLAEVSRRIIQECGDIAHLTSYPTRKWHSKLSDKLRRG
ncbi:hypothetical protein FNV43_RR27164 [Rhamnella rubrinervis]|uniref:Uncharacterized protein n=1 Tax=Rhamnella rubrinervis TaxID=2594499 RepID=A0A8K0DQR8_9ROSA|nr:hypothetical protein FNV43_RR27164 [Rhamnella rubrinervis]